MFESIFSSTEIAAGLNITTVLICMGVSLVLGLIIAGVHMLNERYTKRFVMSLALLPLLVQVVILMVNGNLGTSVAILGAFGLIRFRSMPGDSRELISIFLAMAVGLACGMGQILFAVVFTAIATIVIIILSKTKFGEKAEQAKKLKITIPENLDYSEIFDDIFEKYAKSITLEKVKTTNLGSMFELSYSIVLKPDISEKALIDEIRCRNGNLTVALSRQEINTVEL